MEVVMALQSDWKLDCPSWTGLDFEPFFFFFFVEQELLYAN